MKCLAMNAAKSVFSYSLPMQNGWVALVLVKAVLGIFFVVFQHQPVPVNFSDN